MPYEYKLTLTESELKAIRFAGYRYYTGDDFMKILNSCNQTNDPNFDSCKTSNGTDITYTIPEHKAWDIKELFELEDLRFPLFSDDFKAKLLKLYDSII